MRHIEIIYRSTICSLFQIFGFRNTRCIRENYSSVVVRNATLSEAPVAEINVKIFNPARTKSEKKPFWPEFATPAYAVNILSIVEKEIPIQEALPSKFGYLLRPYIHLHGQTKGYQWEQGRRGLWREFLSTQSKIYTLQCTGNMFT